MNLQAVGVRKHVRVVAIGAYPPLTSEVISEHRACGGDGLNVGPLAHAPQDYHRSRHDQDTLMHQHQSLIDAGVITVTDGVVRLTRQAWVQATNCTPYAETHDTVHFVGFKNDRWWNAVKTFGRPDFVHRFWDARAVAEVMPGDIVVFADGDETQVVNQYAYDDSAHF